MSRGRPSKLPAGVRDTLKQRLLAGEDRKALAAEVGMTVQTINRLAREAGITITDRHWLSDEQVARIERLFGFGLTGAEIADRLHISRSSVSKCKNRGFRRHARTERPIPADLSFQASHQTFNELKAHYQVGHVLLRKWLDEAGIKLPDRQYKAPKRPCPPDFAVKARQMCRTDLLKHYRATSNTISRWKRECGIKMHHEKPKPVVSMVGWADRYFQQRRAA